MAAHASALVLDLLDEPVQHRSVKVLVFMLLPCSTYTYTCCRPRSKQVNKGANRSMSFPQARTKLIIDHRRDNQCDMSWM